MPAPRVPTWTFWVLAALLLASAGSDPPGTALARLPGPAGAAAPVAAGEPSGDAVDGAQSRRALASLRFAPPASAADLAGSRLPRLPEGKSGPDLVARTSVGAIPPVWQGQPPGTAARSRALNLLHLRFAARLRAARSGLLAGGANAPPPPLS